MKQQEKEKEYETYVKEKTPGRKPGPARRECQRIFLQAGVH